MSSNKKETPEQIESKINYAKQQIKMYEKRYNEAIRTYEEFPNLENRANVAIAKSDITNLNAKIFLLENQLRNMLKNQPDEAQPQ